MRKTYIISYDARKADSYDELFEYIKSHGTWAHVTESLWVIRTEKSAADIRDEIGEILPSGSSILVVRSGVEAAWRNVICRNQWLKDHL